MKQASDRLPCQGPSSSWQPSSNRRVSIHWWSSELGLDACGEMFPKTPFLGHPFVSNCGVVLQLDCTWPLKEILSYCGVNFLCRCLLCSQERKDITRPAYIFNYYYLYQSYVITFQVESFLPHTSNKTILDLAKNRFSVNQYRSNSTKWECTVAG